MKKSGLMLLMMAMGILGAVEIDVDGQFNNFSRRSWMLATRRTGTAELVRVNGTNFVQLASENHKRSQIGIYTARGITVKKGDKISVSVDVKGGPVIISIIEYGKKKFIANQDKKFPVSAETQRYKADFTVENSPTDLVRISLKTAGGAVAVISNVKADMTAAGGKGK